jgi:hypothetical protein
MKTIKVIIFVLVLGIIAPLGAQPLGDFPPGGPPPGAGPRGGGPMREKMRERIKTIKIWRLTEKLNLDTEQSEKFFPLYNKFQDDREAIDQQRREVFQRLDELINQEDAKDEDIDKLLDQLDGFDRQLNTNRTEFRKNLEGILTTRQIGNLYVFEVEFARHIQDIVREVREEIHGKGFRRNRD